MNRLTEADHFFYTADEIFSALIGKPSQWRIDRWRRWMAEDAEKGKPWTEEDIKRFVPEVIQPYL